MSVCSCVHIWMGVPVSICIYNLYVAGSGSEGRMHLVATGAYYRCRGI